MGTINEQVVRGHWNEVKGSLRERWGQLTDDDLQAGEGNLDQLVGIIQQKTGQSRERIEAYLEELSQEEGSLLRRASAGLGHTTEAVGGQVAHAAESAQDAARYAYRSAEQMVGHRPLESTLIGFATGMMIGFALGLSMRSR